MGSAIWGLLGAIVGAFASIATAWVGAKSSYELQRRRSSDERIDRANEFQRQTLLDLQEAIHDALRLINRAHIEDSKAHRSTRDWGKNMLSNEVDEGIRLAQRQVSILAARVADDEVREKVKALMKRTIAALLASSEREATFHVNATANEAEEVLELIGTLLTRQLN